MFVTEVHVQYNKKIVARCDWGPWVLYTLGGHMAPSASPQEPFFPLGGTKRHGSRHSVQQLYIQI